MNNELLTIEDLQIGKLYHIKSLGENDALLRTIFIIDKYITNTNEIFPVYNILHVRCMSSKGKVFVRTEYDFKAYIVKELK